MRRCLTPRSGQICVIAWFVAWALLLRPCDLGGAWAQGTGDVPPPAQPGALLPALTHDFERGWTEIQKRLAPWRRVVTQKMHLKRREVRPSRGPSKFNRLGP